MTSLGELSDEDLVAAIYSCKQLIREYRNELEHRFQQRLEADRSPDDLRP